MNELATVNNDSGLDRSERISANLAIAKERLLDTKTDIERMEIRDFARKTYNIAVAAELNEIATEAANLYQFTERKIVEANPPKGRGLAADKNNVLPEDTIKPSTLRNMRQVHANLSDTQFEKLQQEAVDSGEALTRKKLKQYIDDLKGEKDFEKWKTSHEKFVALVLPFFEDVRKLIESGDTDAIIEIYPGLKKLSVDISNYYMQAERDVYKATVYLENEGVK